MLTFPEPLTYVAKISKPLRLWATVVLVEYYFCRYFPWKYDVFCTKLPAFNCEGKVKLKKNYHKITFPTSTCTWHGIMPYPFQRLLILSCYNSESNWVLKIREDKGGTQRQSCQSLSILGSLVWRWIPQFPRVNKRESMKTKPIDVLNDLSLHAITSIMAFLKQTKGYIQNSKHYLHASKYGIVKS